MLLSEYRNKVRFVDYTAMLMMNVILEEEYNVFTKFNIKKVTEQMECNR